MITRRIATALLSATALAAPALAKSASGADGAFADLSARWLDAYLRLQPVGATQTGDHRFDAEIDDMSAAGRAAQVAAWKGYLRELGRIDRAELSRDNQVDAAVLDSQLRYAIWDIESLQSWAWDPQVYSSLAGDALYSLMARDFAPLPVRLRAAIGRMEKLPGLFAQMRSELDVARVPSVHAETVARQNGGVSDIVDSMILPQASVLEPAGQAHLKAVADALKKAVADHQTWLDKSLVPAAKGDFRIGAQRFDEKLAFTLASPMSRKEIRDRAEAAVTRVHTEMYDVALKVLSAHGQPAAASNVVTPQVQYDTIKAALALAAAEHPDRAKVVDTAKMCLARATDFVRGRDLIALPTAPVEVVLMPEFARGVAVAYCDSPGPLDKSMKTFYDVSPIPDDWSDDQANSFLREYNTFGIQDVAVHEAMPGHYVQLWHANSCPSVLRAVLGSGSFIEGWAVYAEGMMVEQGFLGDDPRYKLSQLKVLLRTVTNAILDQAIHVDGISREDAMTLMTKTAFQEEREAAGKWTRASLSSTQLSTYFVGSEEHKAIRAEAMRRDGAGFSLKAYHDKVLSYGSPPARYARALMFGEPIG